MSKHLLDDYPLIVLPQLAVEIGLNEAIALQQIHWLRQQDNFGEWHNNRKWVRMTVREWHDRHFPFWSESTIQRVMDSLVEQLFVDATDEWNKLSFDRTKWFAIRDERIDEVEAQIEARKNAANSGRRIEHVKMGNASPQNDETIPENSVPENSLNTSPENGAVSAEPQLEPASVDRAQADADFSKKFQEIQAKQDQARIDATAQRMLELAEQKASEQAAAPEHLKAVELGKGGAEERRERYRLAASIAEACGTPLVPKHPAYYVAANLFKAPPVKPDGEKATVDEMIAFAKSIPKKLDDANWMPSRMRTYFARIVQPPARPAPEPFHSAAAPAVTQDYAPDFDIEEYRRRRERSMGKRGWNTSHG